MEISAVNNTSKIDPQAKQAKAAKDLESYFINYMLKEMRKTIPKSTLLNGDSFAMQTYYEMLDKQVAENIAENGGFGLAKNMYKDIFNRQTKNVARQNLGEIYK